MSNLVGFARAFGRARANLRLWLARRPGGWWLGPAVHACHSLDGVAVARVPALRPTD